jgi:hypothetical protein
VGPFEIAAALLGAAAIIIVFAALCLIPHARDYKIIGLIVFDGLVVTMLTVD